MKLQHLAIIFVIIILPISMVISSYIQTQIDTISLQTQYNTKLQTATHDAIKAFQLNTINNKYSSVSDSKIRDIEASISTFYNSLGTELGASGYDRESLQQFIPAIVYTMYDGYYIYGKYYNDNENDYQYGLRPYVYYSCRYKDENGTYDFVVNYTLDNSITIYGKVGTEGYVTKSGTLINPDLVEQLTNSQGGEIDIQDISNGTTNINDVKSLEYNEVLIEPEILKEQITILSDSGNATKEEHEYTVYNNQKIYMQVVDLNTATTLQKEKSAYVHFDNMQQYYVYFRYVDNKKQYVTESTSNNDEIEFLNTWTYDGSLNCNSAIEYYTKAKVFSDWVDNNLSTITQQNAVDAVGAKITDFAIDTGKTSIFDLDNSNNDPMLDSSIFNQNRISVIRRTIQTTLNAAIANYSSSASYEFVMPIFTEEDWDRLENNISVAAFMQGIPIGAKYYNNYCIITNNKNKEVVTKDSIYIITNDQGDNSDDMNILNEAHRAASKDVIDGEKLVIAAYRNVDFEPQTVVGNENYTYYPHANARCYECLVNVAETYDVDDIIAGIIYTYNKNEDNYVKNLEAKDNIGTDTNLRKIYLTALARERQNLYKTNDYFGT